MPPATVSWADFERMSKRANVAEGQRDEAWSLAVDHMEAVRRGDATRSGLTVVQELIPILTQSLKREDAFIAHEPPEPYATFQGHEIKERSPGVEMIERERYRQVIEEGYDSEHDDDHAGGAIARAAASYAAPHRLLMEDRFPDGVEYTDTWPWTADDDKRHHRPWTPSELEDPALRRERVHELIKAGALIAAEIDRLERMR